MRESARDPSQPYVPPGTEVPSEDASTVLDVEGTYRLLFEHMDCMVCTLDLSGRFVSVNHTGELLTEYAAEELHGMLAIELIAPELQGAAIGQFQQRLKTETDFPPQESVLVTRDGDHVPIEISSTLVSDEGRLVGVLGFVRDVSERRSEREHALAALARSTAQLAEAQKIAHVGSWEWDIASDVVTWSDELRRIFLVDLQRDLAYGDYLGSVHPDDREAVDEVVKRASATGESFEFEHRIVLPGGGERWIHSRGEVAMGADGPVSMRGTAQDITERKESEEKLREAERRYRTLIEQLPLATYIRPRNMALPNIYASPQVEAMLGYTAEEWESNPALLEAIIHPEDRERVLASATHVRPTGEARRDEYRYIARDGRVVWVEDETYIVEDEDAEPCVQGYLLDITERKEAEEERDRLREELHHAQKLEALGRLAGGVAHDFNNMLTAIKGYSELLLAGLEPESGLRGDVEQIHRTAEQASTLPRQLLAFSRKQVLEPTLLDLDRVVAEASDLVRPLVGETIELVTSGAGRSASVLADPGQIEQVLLNLALNARDAMPNRGTITIATRIEDVTEERAAEADVAPRSYAVISVADTGHGMDAETRAQAFEPFFTTKAPEQGSGLGLSTVYGIVRQSGGFVSVESDPGKGSTFEVYLPCTQSAASDKRRRAPTVPSARNGRPGMVLLVEDQEIVRDVAVKALERFGYSVATATCGDEALAVLHQASAEIDAVVTDLVMPGMDGRELADRIVALSPGMPVVLMSGYADEPPGDGTGSCVAFLHKPFSLSDLLETVRDAIGDANEVGNGAPANGAITCVVGDDHPAVLDAVPRFLELHGFEIVARASRGDEALAEIESRKPTIALLDIGMRPLSGIEVARHAAITVPEVRSVIYTAHHSRDLLAQALDAGAQGFVLKEAPLSDLERALRIVARGDTYVDPDLSTANASSGATREHARLTRREQQVLTLLADGMTNERAGAALGISSETVQSHVRNAMGKLEADTRTEAVALAIRQSLIE
jgi:two-component system, cell cycle sensor histidine kinase and response regulator CckA